MSAVITVATRFDGVFSIILWDNIFFKFFFGTGTVFIFFNIIFDVGVADNV